LIANGSTPFGMPRDEIVMGGDIVMPGGGADGYIASWMNFTGKCLFLADFLRCKSSIGARS